MSGARPPPASAQPPDQCEGGPQCGAGGQPVRTRGQGEDGGLDTSVGARPSPGHQWRWSRYLDSDQWDQLGAQWAAVSSSSVLTLAPNKPQLSSVHLPAIVSGRQ